MLVRPWFLITLIKCFKGGRSPGSLFNVKNQNLLGTMLLVMIGCGSAMSSQVPNILASGLSESGNNAMSGYEDDGEGGTYLVFYQCSAVGFRTENISARDMDCSDLIEKTKKHLRSVLISEKGGVALDRLDRDFRELVSSFDG